MGLINPHRESGSPFQKLGDTFEFTCSNEGYTIPYAVDILPDDTYTSLGAYGAQRCVEESNMWNKYKGTTGTWKFSTKQF